MEGTWDEINVVLLASPPRSREKNVPLEDSLGCSPEDAPLRLDSQDGGILHVLIVQLLMDLGLVHPHGHLHLLKALIGGRGVTDNVLGGSPGRRRNQM